MEDFGNKKKKLLSLKKIIMQMPNNINKVYIIDGYAQLLGFYKEVCGLTIDETKKYDIDEEFVSKYDKRIIKSTQNKIDELSVVAPILYQKYDDIINEYKKNGFCSYEFSLFKRVNPDKLYEIVADFFKFLGTDVAKLYNKIIKNNNIFLLDDCDYSGVSMNALRVDNPCIIIRNVEEYLSYYFTLVHEMGHCYQFYLQRNHSHLEVFNPFTETTSLLFEKMFMFYLIEKHMFKNELVDYELENHIYFLNDLASSKVIFELLMNKDIRNVNIYDLTYESSLSIDELQRKMIMDCGYIMPNKLNLELSEIHYSIGEIIATYFINKMQNDFHSAWKDYKDFITTVDNYPLEDIINKYIDTNLVKNDIKKFIKDYRSR